MIRNHPQMFAALVVAGAAFFFSSVPARADVSPEERARVQIARLELRSMLVPTLMETEDGEWPTPRDVFFREMELILGEHARRRPYHNTVLGERHRALVNLEAVEGFTAYMRAQWEKFFWDWREALDQ